MTKTTKIRMNPVSLNESTLETNIMGEIAALFNFPNKLDLTVRLNWFFNSPNSFPIALGNKRVKIYRLTPPEEYQGGGWDSKVVIPNGEGTNRAVFIQFKAGKHSDGNNIPNSIFNINRKNPNKHAEFSFNNNRNNNQHLTLRNLRDELARQGLPSKSVLYGFPRITDLDTFDKLEESLLLHTTFLSHSEMDAKANANDANLYDGNVHNFRTCYYDETKREISSDPFLIGEKDDSIGFLYEIILVRFAHLRNQLNSTINLDLFTEDFFIMLAEFLRINPFKLYDFKYINRLPLSFQRELKDHYSRVESDSFKNLLVYFGGNSDELANILWRKDLFNRITKFVIERRDNIISVQSDIPSDYSFSLGLEKTVEMRIDEVPTFNLIVF